MEQKKRIFLNHKKSSALLVSIAVHAVFIVVALSFVAVSVVRKNEVDFEVKEVKRPKMNLRKLQVPVNSKKAAEKPKLRKQIVAKPNINKVNPDIKMPEIVGVKGGLGASGGGFGAGASLGFTMPDISFFGVKGKSERIMLILDGDQYMSADELGGAYGFEVIKKECLNLISGLPSTAVFNIVVYGRPNMLFPAMVPATEENVAKAKAWLMPLNQVKGTQTKYGVGTLGPGGITPKGNYPFGKFKEEIYQLRSWNEPVMLAMQQQADMVFLLTGEWGYFGYDVENNAEIRKKWAETSAGKDWAEKVAKGRKLLDEDNAQRTAAGEPKRALNRGSELEIVRAYFPGTQEPPHGERLYLSVEDLVKAFQEAYKAYAKDAPTLGIQKKKASPKFSLNVIYFREENFKNEIDQNDSERDKESLVSLAKGLNGEFREIVGLAAIKSYVDPSSL